MPATQDCPEGTRPNEKVDSADTLIARKRRDHTNPLATEVSTLRYRYRALWLLGIYVPLLVIPWILTCVLLYRPIDHPAYYDQSGIPNDSLKLHRRLMNSLSVIFAITGLVTVPIISAILSEAAVVYTQKRRDTQAVSVRQLFALADRGWSSLAILKDARPAWTRYASQRANASSQFLWLAALFLLICGVQQPLREALMSRKSTLVMTSGKEIDPSAPYAILGYDPEPFDMARIPEDLVVHDLMNSLASFSRYETPPHLWWDPSGHKLRAPDATSSFQQQYGPWSQPFGGHYFLAAFPNATTTGVLRQRVMRLNSTINCDEIRRSDFPSSCGGDNPFVAEFTRAGSTEIRLCIPGRRGTFPWYITRNMQNIAEDMYLDVTGTNYTNFTRHCSVSTVRGYFELGNYRNGETHGFLLDRWEEPDLYAAKSEYNDWLPLIWRARDSRNPSKRGPWRRPSSEDKITDIPDRNELQSNQRPWPQAPASLNSNRTMSGPLMTSIIGLFGERSLLTLANSSTNATDALSQICTSGRMPFSTFEGYEKYADQCSNLTGSNSQDDELLASIMLKFVNETFHDTSEAHNRVAAAVFFTNQALLLQTAQTTQAVTARPIRYAPGESIQIPTISTAGLIIVSILVLIQLVGLAYLAWYIYQVPTWTGLLDAMAIARIANSLDKGTIPGIGSYTREDQNKLGGMTGLIGVVDSVHMDEEANDVLDKKEIQVGLGAPGLFNRKLAKVAMQRAERRRTEIECQCARCQWKSSKAVTGEDSVAPLEARDSGTTQLESRTQDSNRV